MGPEGRSCEVCVGAVCVCVEAEIKESSTPQPSTAEKPLATL